MLHAVAPLFRHQFITPTVLVVGRNSSVDTATCYGLEGPWMNPGSGEISCTRPDRFWGPPSPLYNGYSSFKRVKLSGYIFDHPPLI